jgi:2,6-dihydroxypseudooxynicotine hydrolase
LFNERSRLPTHRFTGYSAFSTEQLAPGIREHKLVATDERVQSAIDNWAPRFIANGVDLNDFQRVTRRTERWDDWCREWSACAAVHERLGEEAEAERHYHSAGQHYFQAAIAYHFGKFLFVHRPDELRAAHDRAVRAYQRALPWFDWSGEPVAIPYEGGTTLRGILRKPWHALRPPIVVLVPGLDSVKEELHAYGDDFLRRGMAVLALDGPGQGEMEFTLPMRFDYEVPVAYAIDYLETRGDVDAGRVGLMGVSLGGYYAPRAAAFEPRLKAAIAIAGFYSIVDSFDRTPALTQQAFTYRLKVPDRSIALERLARFDLGGVLERIRCPLLVIMGRQDRLVPPHDAERVAQEAGDTATLWMFEDGNHVCNNIPYRYRPQQADWMQGRLYA